MTPEELAEIKALAERATPGPWGYQTTKAGNYRCRVRANAGLISIATVHAGIRQTVNGEFIAATDPAAVLALIAALEEAQREIARLEAAAVVANDAYGAACARDMRERAETTARNWIRQDLNGGQLN